MFKMIAAPCRIDVLMKWKWMFTPSHDRHLSLNIYENRETNYPVPKEDDAYVQTNVNV